VGYHFAQPEGGFRASLALALISLPMSGSASVRPKALLQQGGAHRFRQGRRVAVWATNRHGEALLGQPPEQGCARAVEGAAPSKQHSAVVLIHNAPAGE